MEERESEAEPKGGERARREMEDLWGGSILAPKWQNDEKYKSLFFFPPRLFLHTLCRGKDKLFIQIRGAGGIWRLENDADEWLI